MDRRQFVMTAMAAGLLPAGALAATKLAPLFDGTPLADNRVARRFTTLPAIRMPQTRLKGDDGPHTFADLTGKIRIVALWAEWCPPCIAEAGDLAKLHARHGGDAFAVHSILTGSGQGLDVRGARKVLAKTGGDSLPLWVEPHAGSEIGNAYSPTQQQALNLPCTLIVDRTGTVRGRCLGAGFVTDKPIKPNDKKAILATRTEWSLPDADAFVQGLINGALEHDDIK